MVSQLGEPLKEEGYLIRSVNYGEGHRILSFFTHSRGRFDLMALGARKSQKRFGGMLDYFNRLGLFYRENPRASLARLEEVEIFETYPELRQDYDKSIVALAWMKMLNQTLKQELNLPKLYQLLGRALRLLCHQNPLWVDVLFRSQALGHLGYDLGLERRGDLPEGFWDWEGGSKGSFKKYSTDLAKRLDRAYQELVGCQ